MANKNDIDLSNFDFGFSVVDEDELAVVQGAKTEVQEASSTAAQWQAQAEEWKAKTNAIYDAVVPLLNNLQQNEDKEYIYWPNRLDKVEEFSDKLKEVYTA